MNPSRSDDDASPEKPVASDRAADPLLGQLFVSAISSSGIPMLLTDPRQPENPIVFANPAFFALCGYAREEVVGRNCRFLQGADSDRATIDSIRLALGQGKEVSTRLINYRKDGTSFWNALYISPVHGADGELLYFFACQLDMSLREAAAQGTGGPVERTPADRPLLADGAPADAPMAARAPSSVAALRRWRELDRLATTAANNLARREIAEARGDGIVPLLDADRLLAAQLRAAAVRARDEAFDLLAGAAGR